MDSKAHVRFNAEDRSYFSILKKGIHSLVVDAGFNDNRAGEVDIVVAELASNLIKHAGGGEILARIFTENDTPVVELISIDKGPGMYEPSKMIEDGMSTSNTLGQGLGAMKRLCDTFQVYSMKDWGTIVLCRICKDKPQVYMKKPPSETRWLIVAKPGEELSGDSSCYVERDDELRLFMGDGLGHGPEAHKASQQAVTAFRQCSESSPAEILRYINKEVKKTRGLVGTAAIYNYKDRKWRICGIGNIATRTQTVTVTKNHMSYNGIIGMNIPNTLTDQEIEYDRGQVMILCSDGIKTRWELQKYTGIFKYDLSIIAAVIYKDFARHTDDMSVMVSRINAMV